MPKVPLNLVKVKLKTMVNIVDQINVDSQNTLQLMVLVKNVDQAKLPLKINCLA